MSDVVVLESESLSAHSSTYPTDWQQFESFLLQRMNEHTAEDRLRYAKHYGKVLETGNASDLLNLQPDKRIHAMKALSNLAKFMGKYDVWLQLRQRYNLKWSTGTEKLDAFERFFDDNKTLDTMLQWLRQDRSFQSPIQISLCSVH